MENFKKLMTVGKATAKHKEMEDMRNESKKMANHNLGDIQAMQTATEEERKLVIENEVETYGKAKAIHEKENSEHAP